MNANRVCCASLLLSLVGASSCTSIVQRVSGEGPLNLYPGTDQNLVWMRPRARTPEAETSALQTAVGWVDFVPSLALDTVLLPFDLGWRFLRGEMGPPNKAF